MVASFHPPKPIPADPLGRRFCEIFGRRLWDFIEAPTPSLGDKPEWRTVTHYQICPRVLWRRWRDPGTLIGVRFKGQTFYGLIDIDAESPYCNEEAIAQLRAALETIGITRTLLLRSSHSNGLHLYLPLPELVKTFDLAVALHECLTVQDFAIANGTLEIFPNPKPYGVKKIIHYNGHRLPLQPGTGSCLLDNDLNPVSARLDHFFAQWNLAASCQNMDELRHALKIGRDNRRKKPQRRKRLNSTVESWRQDLELEIEEGWSGPGQTNHLLKTVACYSRVFLGLAGDDLIAHSLEMATHLPGYQQHCRHQHELHTRVRAWCKAVEGYYWPLGDEPQRDTSRDVPPTPSVNQQRAEDARDRITQAIESLRQLGTLPSKIRELTQRIAQTARCSLQTVYKHRSLWHPDHTQTLLEKCVTDQPESNPACKQPIPRPQKVLPPSSVNGLKPLSTLLLHTKENTMKCRKSPFPPLQKNLKTSSFRGVRGEDSCFPQPSLESLLCDQSHRLLPPHVTASAEDLEYFQNQDALRQRLSQLKWDYSQVTQYIADQFDGKRLSQLSSEELILLLYRLSNLTSE
ncbi:MAG: hypothetical protein F6K04_15510 [Leptolyngbya sp. SIO4C5]|nr:hypothetical protein [Leptolyngbya sp. SIO4C5]